MEINAKETLEEVKPPIGKFIIDNAVSTQGADGAYYHYSEVCKLLKLQQETLYSEEEVLILLHERDVHTKQQSTFNKGWKTPKEWFKKK